MVRSSNLSIETYNNSATYDTCCLVMHGISCYFSVRENFLRKDFLQACPHHGACGGYHDAPDPQQNGGTPKQNARTQARGVQTNRRK